MGSIFKKTDITKRLTTCIQSWYCW